MARLTIHNEQTAPEDAKARVEAVKKSTGFIPNLIGVLANSPQALAFYQEIGKLNAETSLTGGEREVIQVTAAVLNQCGFCAAGHTKITKLQKLLPDHELEALRKTAKLSDAKLNALAEFTQWVIFQKGKVSDAQLAQFFAAGYTERQAVEVVFGVALATLCNYTNNLAQTEINPELQAFALE